jgi:uncharacterized membrane protein YphA (DoxX/SURF4 family)
MWWTGVVLSVVAALLLLFSGVMKFTPPNEEMLKGLDHIGWAPAKVKTLGILEITCTVLYLIPQTAVIGAILLTGYMGGAIATHYRIDDAFVVQATVPVILWLGLYLREPRLRALIPWRT